MHYREKPRYPRLLWVLWLCCGNAFAIITQGTEIYITATVVAPPPCTLKTVNVDFGKDVVTTQIDGKNYLQPLKYNVECTGAAPGRALKMTITGIGAAFDSTVLRTDVDDLGIKLLANGAAFDLNTPLNFDYGSSPKLDAVPVKKSGATLEGKGGAFNSSATLLLEYR